MDKRQVPKKFCELRFLQHFQKQDLILWSTKRIGSSCHNLLQQECHPWGKHDRRIAKKCLLACYRLKGT